MDAGVPGRHTSLNPRALAAQTDVLDKFLCFDPPSSTTACSHFLRARVRSFGEAALLALPSRVFGGFVASSGLAKPSSFRPNRSVS